MGKIDSSLLDKAIVFAVNAHKDVERRGKGFPYIAHPLEAMAIVASMTNDQELLAAACLHDVIEDTDITYEDIKKHFNKRVADLVQAESDVIIPDKDAANSWVERKQAQMDHIAQAPRDVQMVALGDKLSNMRALARDYELIGDALWNRFHVTDPKLHAWHYRGLAKALINLKDTDAFEEFTYLIDKTFSHDYDEFSFEIKNDNEVYLHGEIDHTSVDLIKEKLNKDTLYYFDFDDVYNINFSGVRFLINLRNDGYHYLIRRTSKKIAAKMATLGLGKEFSITKKPHPFPKEGLEQAGDGYTALTYWTKDGDAMVKLYKPFIPLEEVEKEKRYATEVLSLGLPTPLVGDIVEVDGQYGILFERIHHKISFATKMANNPELTDDLAKDFAVLAKKLHSTECHTDVFRNAKTVYLEYAAELKGLDEIEKNKLKEFINSIPEASTCLHGDFHFGNAIITDDNKQLFIDLGDFSYGHPYFDLGTLYLVCHQRDETVKRLFHNEPERLYQFYQSFIRYYFDNKYTEEELDHILQPYAALTAILFAHKGGEKEWMDMLVRKWIIKD